MIGRREFLKGSTAGVAAAVVGVATRSAGAEPPPETPKLRLIKSNSMCWAPQYVADDLLKAEGFTEVTYLEMPVGQPVSRVLVGGDADIGMNFVGPNLVRVDPGDPVVFLAGVHVGCFEVFGGEHVRSASCRTGSGESTTRKTRSASTPCGSTKPGCSNRARRSSSPRAPTGDSSTS